MQRWGLKSISIGQAIEFGWETWKRNVLFWVGVAVVFIVVEAITQGPGNAARNRPALTFVLSVIGFLINTLLGIGVTRMALRFVDGGRGEFSDLYTGYPLFLNYLIATLLFSLMVGIGLVFLIVPGVILAVVFGFCTFAVVDRALGPIDALQRSAALTRGVRMDVFLFGLLAIAINLVGLLLCGIGLFATYPTTMVAAAHLYRQLDRQVAPAV